MESAAEIKQLEAKIKEDVKQINGACRVNMLLLRCTGERGLF